MSISAASNAFAVETQRAPSYVLQHQSVVGYTPTGILGTTGAPADQGSGITFQKVPGQPVGNDDLALRLPFGSRVTQIVAEGVFPHGGGGAASNFIIGYGKLGGPPILTPPPEHLDYLLTEMVMKDADFVNPASVEGGSVGYVSRFPNLEANYVVLGNGSGGAAYLQADYMREASIKVTISYVVIVDNAATNQLLAINQARPSVRGA